VDGAELAAPLAFRVARAAVQVAGVVERHLDSVRNERRVRVRDRLEIDSRLLLVDQAVVYAKLGKPAEDDRLSLLSGLPIQAGERRNQPAGMRRFAFLRR
jgi:hypothetical protein